VMASFPSKSIVFPGASSIIFIQNPLKFSKKYSSNFRQGKLGRAYKPNYHGLISYGEKREIMPKYDWKYVESFINSKIVDRKPKNKEVTGRKRYDRKRNRS